MQRSGIVEKMLEDIFFLLKSENYEEAEQKINANSYQIAHPEQRTSFILAKAIVFSKGDVRKKIAYLQKNVQEKEKRNSSLLCVLAREYLSINEPIKAIPLIKSALAIDPDSKIGARLAIKAGILPKNDSRSQAIEQRLKLKTAEQCIKQKDFSEAFAGYEKCFGTKEELTAAKRLILILNKIPKKEREKAENLLASAIQNWNTSVFQNFYKSAKGHCAKKKGEIRKAVENQLKRLRQEQQKPIVDQKNSLIAAGDEFRKIGEWEKAFGCYKKIIEISDGDKTCTNVLQRIIPIINRLEKASLLEAQDIAIKLISICSARFLKSQHIRMASAKDNLLISSAISARLKDCGYEAAEESSKSKLPSELDIILKRGLSETKEGRLKDAIQTYKQIVEKYQNLKAIIRLLNIALYYQRKKSNKEREKILIFLIPHVEKIEKFSHFFEIMDITRKIDRRYFLEVVEQKICSFFDSNPAYGLEMALFFRYKDKDIFQKYLHEYEIRVEAPERKYSFWLLTCELLEFTKNSKSAKAIFKELKRIDPAPELLSKYVILLHSLGIDNSELALSNRVWENLGAHEPVDKLAFRVTDWNLVENEERKN